MTLADWLRDAATRLAPISETARLDAELIAAHALGRSRAAMLLNLRDLTMPQEADALLARRLGHEPIAHIIGSRDFWTITVRVSPDVLIPRPDSETLIEAAVAHFAGSAGPVRILDLGTGSGALLLAALDQWPGATGVGVDVSPGAIEVARDNADRLGMTIRADFIENNWAKGIDERFDLILCNPPYIPAGETLSPEVADHEPHGALFAGADGLDCYRILAPDIARLMAPGAIALFEIGHDQGASVPALFAAEGFAPQLLRDLAGRDRCVAIGERTTR